jgi:hypothetical protein
MRLPSSNTVQYKSSQPIPTFHGQNKISPVIAKQQNSPYYKEKDISSSQVFSQP